MSWGKFVGSRYQDNDNIVWLIGGDTDPGPVREKTLAMIKGIRESDNRHLMTAHNAPGSMAVTPWEGQPWLGINNVYSYDSTLYVHYREAYRYRPTLPFFLIESAYENEHRSTPVQWHSQIYQSVLCGGMGCVFGNCPIWHFGSSPKWCGNTDWKSELNNAGSESMKYAADLFTSRPWYRLVPDFEHRYLTGGYGTWGSTGYVTAAATDDGNTFIAYLPDRHPVAVDLSHMSGTESKCWWYNPATGGVTRAGQYKNTSPHLFNPPSTGDWILGIDNAALDLPLPGREE